MSTVFFIATLLTVILLCRNNCHSQPLKLLDLQNQKKRSGSGGGVRRSKSFRRVANGGNNRTLSGGGGSGFMRGKQIYENITIPCNSYPELYRLVKTPGTRSILYIISSTNQSQSIANAYKSCHGNWVETVVLPKSVFFENVIYESFFLQTRAEWKQYDYVITATYKTLTRKLLPRYMPLQTFLHMKEFLKLAKEDNYDVIPFLRDFEEMMPTSVKYHTEYFKMAWDSLLQEMGYNHSFIEQFYTMKAFYRNVFIIKPSILEQLMDFMNRALTIARTDPHVSSLLEHDAKYVLGNPNVAKDIFGTRYYQLHPFIFERLPSFFLYSINAKICTGPDGPCKYNYKG